MSFDHISTFSFFSFINKSHNRNFSSISFRRYNFFVEQKKSITIIEISTFDISRHVTIKFDVSKQNTSEKLILNNNQSQTFSFTNQTKNIFRDIIDISSLIDVNFAFWNDIMTMIIVFVVVSRFVVEFVFVVDNNDNNFSIIKSIENIDYFNFDYEDFFDIDQFIVIFDRHSFYRNVFTFIDHLKCLKKNFFVARVKDLIFICFKSEVLRWFETKFIDMKKKNISSKFLLNVDVLIWSSDSKNEILLFSKSYKLSFIIMSMFVAIKRRDHTYKIFFVILKSSSISRNIINSLRFEIISNLIFVFKFRNR